MFETRPQNSVSAQSSKMFEAAQGAVSVGKAVSHFAEIARLRAGGLVFYWLAFGFSLGSLDAIVRNLNVIFSLRGLLVTPIVLAIPLTFFVLGNRNMAKASALKNQSN
jgi:hypothetical protein